MTYQRVEVITGSEKRRIYSVEDKGRLVAEAFRPGVVASEVARRHGLNVRLLHRWRRPKRTLPPESATRGAGA